MAIQISHRAKAIKPSPTLTVSNLAKEMKAKGIDVINFGVGEPDFDTPDYIKDEAHKALDDNFTRYTASSGIIELREAISAKLKRDNNLDCDPNDILVSPGAKASIFFVLMTICDPRDEVLIPSPYWVSYTSQVEMVDAFPILLPCHHCHILISPTVSTCHTLFTRYTATLFIYTNIHRRRFCQSLAETLFWPGLLLFHLF